MKQALFSIFSKLSLPLIFLFTRPVLAFAQDASIRPRPVGQFGTPGGIADLGAGNFGAIVGRGITILFVLAIVIALVFLVYGGIKWILSGGDKAAVEAARNTIVAAIVGLVVVFLSYFILNLVLGFFGLKLGELVLPTLVVTGS